jgi:hypothetical protein
MESPVIETVTKIKTENGYKLRPAGQGIVYPGTVEGYVVMQHGKTWQKTEYMYANVSRKACVDWIETNKPGKGKPNPFPENTAQHGQTRWKRGTAYWDPKPSVHRQLFVEIDGRLFPIKSNPLPLVLEGYEYKDKK